MQYLFNTKPFQHQLDDWEFTKNKKEWGVFWEQGTGKSKYMIDTAGWLALNNEIDGVFIVAPNGVHTNWIGQIDEHLPFYITRRAFAYSSSKAKQKWHINEVNRILTKDCGRKLTFLTMSFNGIMTDEGRRVAKEFLTRYQCLYIVDESTRIKSPSAKTTKRVVASGPYAKYRRILSGTPITNQPYDIYSQIRFLDGNFWKKHGMETFAAFKSRYCITMDMSLPSKNEESFSRKRAYAYELILGYQNLDELQELVSQISSRVLKKDVLDLPPKMYTSLKFDLEPDQRRAYDQLKTQYLAELENGSETSSTLGIVRMTRLHQITCGYVKDDDKNLFIFRSNPRLILFSELTRDMSNQCLVWAKSNFDIDRIMTLLGPRAVQYDGRIKQDDREIALKLFKSGEKQFFVSKASTAGIGLTLTEASEAIYYSNSFNLEYRQQSEDRCHRIGSEKWQSVLYKDLECPGTLDTRIIESLRNKIDVQSEVLKDGIRPWLI